MATRPTTNLSSRYAPHTNAPLSRVVIRCAAPVFSLISSQAMFTVATQGYPQPFEQSSSWGHAFQEFTTLCLNTDPDKRPMAKELLQVRFPFLECWCVLLTRSAGALCSTNSYNEPIRRKVWRRFFAASLSCRRFFLSSIFPMFIFLHCWNASVALSGCTCSLTLERKKRKRLMMITELR